MTIVIKLKNQRGVKVFEKVITESICFSSTQLSFDTWIINGHKEFLLQDIVSLCIFP